MHAAAVKNGPYPQEGARVKYGAKKKYDWTEKWKCGHSGMYHDERNNNLSPQKRRPNRRHGTVRVNCSAYIWLRKRVGEGTVEVEYKWQHTGHEIGTVQDMASTRLSNQVKIWLNNRVNEGLDWNSIKPLLRIDDTTLDQVSRSHHALHLRLTSHTLLGPIRNVQRDSRGTPSSADGCIQCNPPSSSAGCTAGSRRAS